MNTNVPAVETPKTLLTWLKLSVSRKKALEYLGMFALLTAIYYCYFVRDAKLNDSSPVMAVTYSQLAVIMARFLIATSWPFTFMAFFDSTWRSRDMRISFYWICLMT